MSCNKYYLLAEVPRLTRGILKTIKIFSLSQGSHGFPKKKDNLVNLFGQLKLTETISRTDEGQPRPKYIFNKCGTNIYFFTLQRFGPSQSPNFINIYDHRAFYVEDRLIF